SFMADAVVRTPRGIAVATPPAISAKDELPVVMSDLHSAGFFRAAVGALDCLGASIVGIAALPIPISRCDLRQARRALPTEARDQSTELQSALGERLTRVINTTGPNGWLDWTYDYRNMLIHRARRLVIKQLRPRSTRIFGPDGREVIRVDVLEQM